MSTAGAAPAVPRAVTLIAHRVAPIGGMERAVYELARGLLARGYTVQVISRQCELKPSPALIWRRVGGPSTPSALAEPWFLVQASWLLARHRLGLVHTVGSIVANRVDVVTVQFCHQAFQAGFTEPRRSRDSFAYRVNEFVVKAFVRVCERWSYMPGRARRMVAVSRGIQRELLHWSPGQTDRVSVIPNGADLEVFAPDPAHRAQVRAQLGLGAQLTAAFVGGDWPRKGLRFAIEALACAPGWDLIVAGAGDVEGQLARARQLGVAERVHFVGHHRDPSPFFAAADAFVLPTAYEAHSLVMLEAAASGCPVLICPVNGVEEVICDGVNGWLIERDAGSIAARLNELAEDPERRRAMGVAARESVREFTWPRVVGDYTALYDALAMR